MPTPSFQTARLSGGRHASPHDGACVMELSSMLAGERFSDHPRSVCPVLAMVLRAYNDGIDDERRQDLYAYASIVVGSRDRRARRARATRFAEFFGCKDRRPYGRGLRSLGVAALGYAHNADGDAHQRFLKLFDEMTGLEAGALTPRGVAI
jgi:hypothetical protein